MDAGYYSEKNIQALYKANIRFVCRMKQNLSLYKTLAAKYKDQLESQENMVKFGKRVVFIKKKAVQLAPDCPGFAYICLDLARKSIETTPLTEIPINENQGVVLPALTVYCIRQNQARTL